MNCSLVQILCLVIDFSTHNPKHLHSYASHLWFDFYSAWTLNFQVTLEKVYRYSSRGTSCKFHKRYGEKKTPSVLIVNTSFTDFRSGQCSKLQFRKYNQKYCFQTALFYHPRYMRLCDLSYSLSMSKPI
jgi:hypothetical protein